MGYPIKGTFIDEISYDIPATNTTHEDWIKDLDSMQEVGIDTVIFIRGYFEGKCIFPSKNFGGKDDLLGFILNECDKRGMKVFIGMYVKNLTWDNGKYENEIKMNDLFTDEVIERYGTHKSFYGWYIPHEVGNICLNITKIFKELSMMCKEKTPDKKVLISPFFLSTVLVKEGYLSPIEMYHEWDKLFEESGNDIDYCAFQDGSAPFDQMVDYFINVKKACNKHGVELWDNVELMGRGSTDFKPISIDLLTKKIEMISKYCKNVITFEFSHFISPNSFVKEANKLYFEYKEYYKN